MVIGGELSDKYGSRIISTAGLVISLAGLLGIATMNYDTPYWILAVWMFINSFGSGLFQPPNTSVIMASVSPERRGVASSMRAFFNSAGSIYRRDNRGFVLSAMITVPAIIVSAMRGKEDIRRESG